MGAAQALLPGKLVCIPSLPLGGHSVNLCRHHDPCEPHSSHLQIGVMTVTPQGHERMGVCGTRAPQLLLLKLVTHRDKQLPSRGSGLGWAEFFWVHSKRVLLSTPRPPVLQCPWAWVTESLRVL